MLFLVIHSSRASSGTATRSIAPPFVTPRSPLHFSLPPNTVQDIQDHPILTWKFHSISLLSHDIITVFNDSNGLNSEDTASPPLKRTQAFPHLTWKCSFPPLSRKQLDIWILPRKSKRSPLIHLSSISTSSVTRKNEYADFDDL